MKKILMSALVAMSIMICCTGCTDNVMTRNFGGSQTINLDKNVRVVNVTWKKDSLWILTTTTGTSSPKTYKFKEDSSFGILEGSISINEK